MGGASSVFLNSSGVNSVSPQFVGSVCDSNNAESDPSAGKSLGAWLSAASPKDIEALEAQALAAARTLMQADAAMFERIVKRAREVVHVDTGSGVGSSVEPGGEAMGKAGGFAVDLLQELNALRKDPSSFIPVLEEHLNSFEDDHVYRSRTSDGKLINVRTHDGRAGVLSAIEFLRDAKPAPQLVISPALQRAAEDLVKDLRDSNPEAGIDSSTLVSRVERHALWSGRLSENCCWGEASPRAVLGSMLVDDGMPSRSHRLNLLQQDLAFMGAACGPHPEYDHVCILDMACLAKDLANVVQGDVTISSKDPNHPRSSSLQLPKGPGGTVFDRVLDSIPVPAVVEEARREIGASQALEVEIEYSFAEKRAEVRYITKASKRTKKIRWGQTAVAST